jgi:hypothetical protein
MPGDPEDNDNEQRLRDAGVIVENVALPEAYEAFVEGLTPSEVDVLVALKRRLDEAQRVSDADVITIMMPP